MGARLTLPPTGERSKAAFAPTQAAIPVILSTAGDVEQGGAADTRATAITEEAGSAPVVLWDAPTRLGANREEGRTGDSAAPSGDAAAAAAAAALVAVPVVVSSPSVLDSEAAAAKDKGEMSPNADPNSSVAGEPAHSVSAGGGSISSAELSSPESGRRAVAREED